MGKMQKFTIVPMLMAGMIVFNGCGSKGAIKHDQHPPTEIDRYISETRKLVNFSEEKVEVVFHRAGSYQEYAKNVNQKKFKYGDGRTDVKDVAVLMDRSFGENGGNGIEIDARTVPGSSEYPNVYIVHDEIDDGELSAQAKAYLKKNTLTEVLIHFIRNHFLGQRADSPSGKYLFIELKIPKPYWHLNHSPLTPKQQQYIEIIIWKLRETIESEIGSGVAGESVRRHIGFASFNLFALEYAHEIALRNDQSGFQYNFIAATNRGLLGYLANTVGSREINYLNSELTRKIVSHTWLTGIWFDPAGINRIAETFNGINDQRKSPLDLYISTYKLKRESYLKRLRKGMATDDNGKAVKLNNVRGLIFDIQAWKE